MICFVYNVGIFILHSIFLIINNQAVNYINFIFLFMRSDRVSYDFTNWTNSNSSSRVNANQTPKNKQQNQAFN